MGAEWEAESPEIPSIIRRGLDTATGSHYRVSLYFRISKSRTPVQWGFLKTKSESV